MLEAELLQTIFHDAGDLVVILHANRCVNVGNPAFNRVVPGARPGVDFLNLVAHAHRSRVLPKLVRAAGGEEVLIEVPHGPGNPVVEYRFFPIEGGMVAGLGRVRVVEPSEREQLGQAKAELRAKSRMLDEIQLELTQVPFIDPVTGVWNRMQVIERLTGEWSRCERYGTPLTCLLVDVEGLDGVRLGTTMIGADEVLKAVARRLKSVVRDHDMVGRFGGDCFVVVAVQSDHEGAHELCGRISEAIEAEPIAVEHGIVPVELRMGGATNKSEGVEILEDLFTVAEGALQDARAQKLKVKVADEVTV
jgi:diguanylate cyclase (GGDEF)-like protein